MISRDDNGMVEDVEQPVLQFRVFDSKCLIKVRL